MDTELEEGTLTSSIEERRCQLQWSMDDAAHTLEDSKVQKLAKN